MRECQECGRWGPTHAHHKIPKGRDKRGWDFPGNLIVLCVDCHLGARGPHKCREKALQYFREVQGFLLGALTQEFYQPEELAAAIKLPLKQAYKVVKLIPVYQEGYRREDIIYRLLGNRYDWGEAHAV